MTVSHVSDVTLLRRRYQLLPEGILPRVEEHLVECETCRGRNEELEKAWKIFDQWSAPAPSEGELGKALTAALERPLRRPMAPPPKPRGDEVRTEKVRGEDSTVKPLPKAPAIPRFVAWGLFFLAAILLGIGSALWVYVGSVRIESILVVTGPEEAEPGARINVRAKFTSPDGDPISGAKVKLTLKGEGVEDPPTEAKTDAQGEAVLYAMVPKIGDYTATVEAEKEVVQRTSLAISARPKPQLSLALFGAPARVGGEVHAKARLVTASAGQPIRDALVLFEAFEPSGVRVARTEAHSDPQGNASFTLPIDPWARTGLWTLVVTASSVRVESNFDIEGQPTDSLLVDASALLLADGSTQIKVTADDPSGLFLEGQATVKGGGTQSSQPLVDGSALLSLPKEAASKEVDIFVEAPGHSWHQTIPVKRALSLSFVPEGGALHASMPLRGVIRVVTPNQKRSVEVEVLSEGLVVAKAKTDEEGYASVELPASALKKELTLRSEGFEERTTPPVKDGAAIFCERVMAVVGEQLPCRVFLPQPAATLLYVSQHGRLVSTVPITPKDLSGEVNIPITSAGVLELNFGDPKDRFAFVYASHPTDLKVSLSASQPSQAGEAIPIGINVTDQAGKGAAATVVVGLLEEPSEGHLPTINEAQTRYLLGSYAGIPARAQERSTYYSDAPRVNVLRQAYGERLRWVVTALLLLVWTGIGLWLWSAYGAFFWASLLCALLSFGAGLAVGLWVIPLAYLSTLGVAVLVRRSARATGVAWAVSFLAVLGLYAVARFWEWRPEALAEENDAIPLPHAAPAVPLPQLQTLLVPFATLQTSPEGKVQWDASTPKPTDALYLYAEAFTDEGAGVAQKVVPLPPVEGTLWARFPEAMTVGDRVKMPISLHPTQGISSGSFSVDVTPLGEGVTVRGTPLRLQPTPEQMRAAIELAATSAGDVDLTFTGFSSSGASRLYRDITVRVLPKELPAIDARWGSTESSTELTFPPKTTQARLWLFLRSEDAARWQLDRLSGMLGCTISRSAHIELLSALVARQGIEAPAVALQKAQESIAALEVEGGGFSACGGEKIDLFSTAVAVVALRDLAEVTAVDPSLVSRARTALAEALSQEKASVPQAAFFSWALLAAGGADDPTIRRVIDGLLAKLPQDPSGLPSYSLSVATVALQQANKKDLAAQYAKVLQERLAQASPLLSAQEPTAAGASSADADIEATYFALLASAPGTEEAKKLQETLRATTAQNPWLIALLRRADLVSLTDPTPTPRSVTLSTAPDFAMQLDVEHPFLSLPVEVARNAQSATLTSNGRIFYFLETITTQEAKPPSFTVRWPEQAKQGETIQAEVSLPAQPLGSMLALALPSLVEADLEALRAMRDSGAIDRFIVSRGILWVALPASVEKVSLPLTVVRSGTATIPVAQLVPLADPALASRSTESRLEATP